MQNGYGSIKDHSVETPSNGNENAKKSALTNRYVNLLRGKLYKYYCCSEKHKLKGCDI